MITHWHSMAVGPALGIQRKSKSVQNRVSIKVPIRYKCIKYFILRHYFNSVYTFFKYVLKDSKSNYVLC